MTINPIIEAPQNLEHLCVNDAKFHLNIKWNADEKQNARLIINNRFDTWNKRACLMCSEQKRTWCYCCDWLDRKTGVLEPLVQKKNTFCKREAENE